MQKYYSMCFNLQTSNSVKKIYIYNQKDCSQDYRKRGYDKLKLFAVYDSNSQFGILFKQTWEHLDQRAKSPLPFQFSWNSLLKGLWLVKLCHCSSLCHCQSWVRREKFFWAVLVEGTRVCGEHSFWKGGCWANRNKMYPTMDGPGQPKKDIMINTGKEEERQ